MRVLKGEHISMKTFYGTTIDVGTVETLRETSTRLRVPVGELLALCVRYSLSRFDDAALVKWASGVDDQRGRPAGGLKKRDRLVLAAFKTLIARTPGQSWFDASELSDVAGLRGAVGYLTLQELARRGFARTMVLPDVKNDRWGRPVSSNWQLTDEGRALAG